MYDAARICRKIASHSYRIIRKHLLTGEQFAEAELEHLENFAIPLICSIPIARNGIESLDAELQERFLDAFELEEVSSLYAILAAVLLNILQDNEWNSRFAEYGTKGFVILERRENWLNMQRFMYEINRVCCEMLGKPFDLDDEDLVSS
jgi:hypothetical protein